MQLIEVRVLVPSQRRQQHESLLPRHEVAGRAEVRRLRFDVEVKRADVRQAHWCSDKAESHLRPGCDMFNVGLGHRIKNPQIAGILQHPKEPRDPQSERGSGNRQTESDSGDQA